MGGIDTACTVPVEAQLVTYKWDVTCLKDAFESFFWPFNPLIDGMPSRLLGTSLLNPNSPFTARNPNPHAHSTF
jgi:hypothetical protein